MFTVEFSPGVRPRDSRSGEHPGVSPGSVYGNLATVNGRGLRYFPVTRAYRRPPAPAAGFLQDDPNRRPLGLLFRIGSLLYLTREGLAEQGWPLGVSGVVLP